MRNSVAIYTRVSTNDQTTIQQEEELKKYCSMRGWDNITIYSDKVSGTKSSRKGLDVPKNEFRILQGLSQDNEILRLASEKSYDYLLIDGDHSYEGVKRDFDLYFELMSKNSLILFDDYNTPEWPQIQQYVDDEILNREDLEFVGADWRTAIFRKL